MNGAIDPSGRALISVHVSCAESATHLDLQVWIDTGFTGDLVMPRSIIERLALPQSGTVSAILADGSQTTLCTYTCQIDWFGKSQNLEIVANDGEHPLLGVGLLWNRRLIVDYRKLELSID